MAGKIYIEKESTVIVIGELSYVIDWVNGTSAVIGEGIEKHAISFWTPWFEQQLKYNLIPD